MKTATLPEVNWAELYGKLCEAVDFAGFEVVMDQNGVMNLVAKAD